MTKHVILTLCLVVACGGAGTAGDAKKSDAGQGANSVSARSVDSGNGKASGECGDGHEDDGEECDDGNQTDDDDCSNDCTENKCGNGRKDPGEACDDGNDKDDATCPANCHKSRCRDGHVDPGEECDDGNQIDTDGCNNRCKIMKCGDGKKQDREECDDGNQVDDDDCSNICTENKCGNKRVDPGEACDEPVNCVDCQRPKDDRCTKCEEEHCRTHYPDPDVDIDWVAGCLENKPDERYVKDPVAPGQYSKPCQAILTCARTNQCVTEPLRGAQVCLCGTASPSDCQDEKLANGPCRDLYLAGAFTTTWLDMFKRVENPGFPLGYASLLLKCDVEFCKAECAPWTVQ